MNGTYEEVFNLFMEAVRSASDKDSQSSDYCIPVGISNRHIHLSKTDLEELFGKGYELNPLKDLSQPGQYACKEMVTICGPKGAIEKVRVLGPVRNQTQAEILAGDCFKLGVKGKVRLSGKLAGTTGITIVGPAGTVVIKEGLMVAKRHIHMSLQDAEYFKVSNGQIVSIEIEGERGGIYSNVAIRSDNKSSLECHLDMEEANAMGIKKDTKIKIIK